MSDPVRQSTDDTWRAALAVAHHENARLRAFVQRIADIFEGKALGDDARAALGLPPADKRHPDDKR